MTGQPVVTVSHVYKSFGAISAVSDVSISVGSGELLALLGPNGAGKSTLIRMIVGLIRPDRGSVVHGAAGNGTAAAIRPRLGYLPEERGLYQDMAILGTLTYFGALQDMPPRQATEAAKVWLERLGLADRAHEKVKALSKGNQQKVQFVASILHRPPLVILDEPFSGLDPVNQELFLDLIRELTDSGTTVVFSAHQMTLVERLADRVVLMSRGREVLSGTMADLRAKWHTGERLVIGLETGADASFLQAIDAVDEIEEHTPAEIRLRLKAGARISGLLKAIGDRLDVRYVRSEQTTLHEIYVRTVEADASAVASPEADGAVT